MKQYLNFKQTKANYSFQHGFNLVFKKIETVFFSFLCVICLITSKLDNQFSKNVSFGFVEVSMPIVKVAAFPFNVTIGFFAELRELIDAKKENKILKEDVLNLKNFYLQALNIHQENKELRHLLNFISAKSSNFKVARIIGRTHQMFNQKIFIDAGKNRGIKEGSLVTGNQAVIGRIEEVGDDKSLLILLTDAMSRIPIITSKSRIRGILAGNNSDNMEILYLPKTNNIEVGDRIFTSGDGDTLPPGLLVGVVKKVENDSVFVTMVEDLSNADIITIMDY